MRRDTVTGIFFLIAAAFFAYFSSRLDMGTARSMGPGYLPGICGVTLGVIGAFILISDLIKRDAPEIGRVNWRALLCLFTAVMMFGVLLQPLGLLITVIIIVMIGSLANPSPRPLESLALGTFFAIFATLTFVSGIGLRLPVWPTIF